MIRENLQKNIITLLMLSFIPLFMEFIIIIILSLIIGSKMNEFFNIICIFISMGISSVIFPYKLLKIIYDIKLSDIGIKFNNLSKRQIVLNIFILLMNLIVFKKLDFINSILLIFHNIVIAI